MRQGETRNHLRGGSRTLSAALILFVGVIATLGIQGDAWAAPKAAACEPNQNVIDAARTVGPAVVTVVNMRSPGGGRPPEEYGLGSGFIVRKDGLILTNEHVVAGADRVEVILLGNRRETARILGADPRVDIAVIRIPGTNLPVVTMGNSDTLQVGQQVIAIGNPLGFERTVTVGVVSALNRAIPDGDSSLRDLVQTDAAIGPGNSGGPLLDGCGRVIGLNVAVVAARTSSGGLGFAVPIRVAQRALRDAEQYGRIIVPWMGISYTAITPDLARSYDLPVRQGVIVGSVAANSPAAAAGLKRGDIITELNGKALQGAAQLEEFIRGASVGQSATLTILRDGHRQQVTVTLQEMPRALTTRE